MNNQIGLQSDITNDIVGHVILLQHDNVYTLGTATDENSFLKSSIDTTSTTASELDYEIFEIERGGQATYHGPGQIVMYPIIDMWICKCYSNCYSKWCRYCWSLVT